MPRRSCTCNPTAPYSYATCTCAGYDAASNMCARGESTRNNSCEMSGDGGSKNIGLRSSDKDPSLERCVCPPHQISCSPIRKISHACSQASQSNCSCSPTAQRGRRRYRNSYYSGKYVESFDTPSVSPKSCSISPSPICVIRQSSCSPQPSQCTCPTVCESPTFCLTQTRSRCVVPVSQPQISVTPIGHTQICVTSVRRKCVSPARRPSIYIHSPVPSPVPCPPQRYSTIDIQASVSPVCHTSFTKRCSTASPVRQVRVSQFSPVRTASSSTYKLDKSKRKNKPSKSIVRYSCLAGRTFCNENCGCNACSFQKSSHIWERDKTCMPVSTTVTTIRKASFKY